MCRISNLGLGQVREGFQFPATERLCHICISAGAWAGGLGFDSALGDPRQQLISLEPL